MVRNATFGKLFKTTRYGSDTFAKNPDHHSIIAIIIPIPVPNKNPTTVSYVVTCMCFIKSFAPKFVSVFHILLGWLVMKLSIMLLFASSSQIPKNVINIPI